MHFQIVSSQYILHDAYIIVCSTFNGFKKTGTVGFKSPCKTKMIGKSHKYQELSLLSQLNQQIIHLSKMIILYKITQKLKVVNVYIKMPYIILGISLVSKNNVFVTKLYIDYMYKLSNKGLATMTNDSS